MQQLPFGSASTPVTRIGLGLAALGRPAYMTVGRAEDLGPDRSLAAMERQSHLVLDTAWAAGVRYVDVARSYGDAEAFLASWLATRGIVPGALGVGSKWGYTYVGGWRMDARTHEVKDLSVDTLRRQLQESRARLGPYLSLYQIHSATLESGVLDDCAVSSELSALKASGVAVGLTVTGANQQGTIRRALESRVDGRPLFDGIQATWNLLEPSAGPALAEAHAAGRGVIVKEVVANGRLTDARPDASTEALRREAIARGTSLVSLAVAAALAQPWVDVVLSGAATPSQLQEQLAASTLDVDVRDLLTHAEPPADYWERRGRLEWR